MVNGYRERDLGYIFHLTDIKNLDNILSYGLCCRKGLSGFFDVADPELIDFRERVGLDEYVPFHFFPKNPFDGRVQKDYPDSEFIYICVSKYVAQENNFGIIPGHPKSLYPLWDNVYDYDIGIKQIDWDTLETRNYTDWHTRNVCMAECICPEIVYTHDFSVIVTSCPESANYVKRLLNEHYIDYIDIAIEPYWFV